MARVMRSFCSVPGCRDLATYRGRCKRHVRQAEQQRGTAASRGYGSEWQREAAAWLKVHPVCVYCGGPSEMVEHRIAHKGNQGAFWDRTNWVASCIPCNSRKCVEQEGGFGR